MAHFKMPAEALLPENKERQDQMTDYQWLMQQQWQQQQRQKQQQGAGTIIP